MECISINYRHSDISVRERLAFAEGTQTEIMRAVCGNLSAQCVILCTCNRTEIYFSGVSDECILKILSDYSGISQSEIIPDVCFYREEKAVLHLFRVAGGLCSMVLGEDEILRQTKNAYRKACEAGAVSYEFHRIFQAAAACAKRIKTETPISRVSVSVASIAANEAAKYGKKILVIGASGQTGTTAVKNLLSHKNVRITATVRRHGSNIRIADSRISEAEYSERYKYIAESDCIISATSCPHYTVTLNELKKMNISGKKLFIDLAVPPDIDKGITQIPGISRLGIDDFKRLAEENHNIRAGSIETAEYIIAEEIENLHKEIIFHNFLPSKDLVCKRLADNPEQAVFSLKKELDAETLSRVLDILGGI
ncbi:MAG: glutamyl-tRNA reductase [Ruminococcus sp.]|nr:glutamyl-tRNA reductase [Ruminococcus sp.]